MALFNHYLLAIGFPAALILFLAAAIIAFVRSKRPAALFMIIGFALAIVGHFLQNYGIGAPTLTEAGDAVFDLPPWFYQGRIIFALGILLGSASLVVFVRGTAQPNKSLEPTR